jgi:hypothetical protein
VQIARASPDEGQVAKGGRLTSGRASLTRTQGEAQCSARASPEDAVSGVRTPSGVRPQATSRSFWDSASDWSFLSDWFSI